ncbi:GR28B protein, partial [Pseudoatta argentina]
MYLNFIFCKILGIFPYKITVSTFVISKPQYIPWIIITSAICIYELIMFYKLNFSEIVTLEVPKTISYNFHFILGAFGTIVWYVLSGPRMRLLQTIREISSRLPPESYQKLSKLIHVKDIFGFFFLLSCFKEINDTLGNLRELMINDIFKLIYHEQKHTFMLTELKALKKQYLMVSGTVKILNIIFSLQLLVTIVIVFKQITFFLYYHIVQWQDGLSIKLDKQIRNEFFVSCIMYYLIRITLIVWACETGNNQAVKIGTTVHNVLNTISDEQIKYELQLFSLQILQCDNTFSTKGLTMANSITTYLLILIQFLGTSHSCDGKTAINLFFATAVMEHYISLQILQLNMLYVNCVFVLKACFKRIDDNLMIPREFVIKDKSHIPRLIYYNQRNPLLLEEFKVLRKEHLMVSNTVQMLNKNFSLQLLLHLFSLQILHSNNTFSMKFLTVDATFLTAQIHHTYVLTYVTYYFVKIALIAWACETGKNQAIKIKTTIHDVLNNINDEQIKHEMMGTITTYFLILIQFLTLSHSCDGNTASNVTQTI